MSMNIGTLIINTNKYDIEVCKSIIVVKDTQSDEVVYKQEGTYVSIAVGSIDEALELIEMVKKIKGTIE